MSDEKTKNNSGQKLNGIKFDGDDVKNKLIQLVKMASIGELGGGIAHELNNPLGGILGYCQFILDKIKRKDCPENNKDWQRYIETLERESARCKNIVENLLKISRVPLSTDPKIVDIADILEETFTFVRYKLYLENIKIIKNIESNSTFVYGKSHQLRQVFIHIILNALQSMPGGGELKVDVNNISNDKRVNAEQLKIEFIDTGCGISKEILPNVFEPFFTTKENGKGLGLWASYEIIREHKGKITINSEEGRGSQVSIILPMAR